MNLPLHRFKTYSVIDKSLTRPATCEEIECEQYKNGWMIPKSALSEADLYAIDQSGRVYREMDITGLDKAERDIQLIFAPGQPCFKASTHTIKLENSEIYLAGRGKGRLYDPRDAITHSGPQAWLDDFWNNQDKLQRLADRS
jgi:hypothetical protein